MKLRYVVRHLKHPKFDNDNGLDYDVGVAKVKTPFLMNAIEKPVPLVRAGEDPDPGEHAIVSGWGDNRVSAYFLRSFVNTMQGRLQKNFKEKKCVFHFSWFILILNVIDTSSESLPYNRVNCRMLTKVRLSKFFLGCVMTFTPIVRFLQEAPWWRESSSMSVAAMSVSLNKRFR